MPKLHNTKALKPTRKPLRNKGTSAEACLWLLLKQKKVGGFKFRRQHSVRNYVLDFYCPELRLAIELDGEPHARLGKIASDRERYNYLATLGITVFRYENRWVFEYPEVIKEEILEFAKKLNKRG